jgi:hypothetical protein
MLRGKCRTVWLMRYDVDASFSMLWLASLQKLRVAWCAGAVPHELPAVLEGSMYGNPTPCSPCIMSTITITQRSARLQGPHAALRHRHGIACTLSHERMDHAANDMSNKGCWLVTVGLAVRFVLNRQAVFKCMLGSYPLWASTYLGIVVGCHQIEDGQSL